MLKVVLFGLLLLGACAPSPAPVPSGPWTALNQTYWVPTQEQLDAAPK